jgi:hypothetical protein
MEVDEAESLLKSFNEATANSVISHTLCLES